MFINYIFMCSVIQKCKKSAGLFLFHAVDEASSRQRTHKVYAPKFMRSVCAVDEAASRYRTHKVYAPKFMCSVYAVDETASRYRTHKVYAPKFMCSVIHKCKKSSGFFLFYAGGEAASRIL